MNNHWWGNVRPNVNDDEKIWPKLPDSAIQEQSQIKSNETLQIFEISRNPASGSENDEFHETLNEVDYPKIGGIVLERKHSSVKNIQRERYDSCSLWKSKKFRGNLIHVNLQKALEAQGLSFLPQADRPPKITVDICKLNVNMSVASSLDCRWLLSKPKRISGHGKKKKLSRLKSLIAHTRLLRRDFNVTRRQICEIEQAKGDIPEINFDKLNIDVVPRDDAELLQKMAALSCLNNDYRNSNSINISEDTVIFRPDMHERMDNLSLVEIHDGQYETDDVNDHPDVCKTELIDCDMMEATLNLKVCDDDGESMNNKIYIKQEPSRIQFSKKFREYCTNTLTPDLKKDLEEFLAEISRLQKKMYERDNVKGKIKRRYYAGIKEVQKHIDLKKIKFVIVAPDLEKVELEGGLDDALSQLIGTCKKHKVPYCFGLGRRKLGYYTHGNGFVSCIGIANYSAAEEKLKKVLLDVVEARNEFDRLANDEDNTINVDKLLPKEELILSETINAYLKILASSS